jgi:hypothetical protein
LGHFVAYQTVQDDATAQSLKILLDRDPRLVGSRVEIGRDKGKQKATTTTTAADETEQGHKANVRIVSASMGQIEVPDGGYLIQ